VAITDLKVPRHSPLVLLIVQNENHTEHTNTVRTSQETHYVSTTKPNRLMLFEETVAVYCEKPTDHINALCG
jgi:hypothetical protein